MTPPPQLPSVLIVDDDADFCESAFDCFDDKGFDVNATLDAITALHLARTGEYDVAVIDRYMPGVDGISLFLQMQARHPPIQGILVTGADTDGTDRLARDAGFAHILYKPLDFKELLQTVEGVGNGQPVDSWREP
ncbi:MAG: response regulator [Planctomycetota bacterium]